jgi:hypothetical protein
MHIDLINCQLLNWNALKETDRTRHPKHLSSYHLINFCVVGVNNQSKNQGEKEVNRVKFFDRIRKTTGYRNPN